MLRTEPLQIHEDARGQLLKVHPGAVAGEVYVITTLPGQARGHHYHRQMGEWFAAVSGQGEVRAQDPATGKTAAVPLAGVRIYVPPGVAHVLISTGDTPLIVVACAEQGHDPEDVVPWTVPL